MNLSTIDNLPLQRANIGAFVSWTTCGLINCLFSILNIAVLKTSKSLTHVTLHLAIQMSMVEALGGISEAAIGLYHLYYIFRNMAETNTTLHCFLIGGVSYMFFVSSLAFMYLALSFDRCFSSLLPDIYRNSSKNVKRFFTVLTLFVPIAICMLGFLDVSDTRYTPICILRQSLSVFGFLLFTYSMLSVSIVSVLMYGLILILLKIKLRRIQKSGGNVSEITAKIRSKSTKALAGNAFLHLLTFTFGAFGNLVVTYLANNGANLGSYFVPFYHIGGVTSFVMYYKFQNQFRSGFKTVVRRIFLRKPPIIMLPQRSQNVSTLMNSQTVSHQSKGVYNKRVRTTTNRIQPWDLQLT